MMRNMWRLAVVAAFCLAAAIDGPVVLAQGMNKAPTVTGSGCAQAVEAWKGLSSSNSVEVLKGFRAGVPKTCPDQLAAASARIAKLEAAAARPKTSGRAATTSGRVFRDCPDCPEMVTIPAGSFQMGSPDYEGGRSPSEGPRRTVSVPAFAVGKYEVSLGEFRRFVDETGYSPEGNCFADFDGDGKWAETAAANWTNPGFSQLDAQPVVCVSWADAKAYASWLSDRTGKPYRLLSEAEWEYAARAGTTSAYSFGASISASQANSSGGPGKTTPVGQYPANGFGLYDMHGNVLEWVEDCYENSYSAGQSSDGRAFTSGSCPLRVSRGGAWNINPQYLRSAFRMRFTPGYQGSVLGFRLARTLP